MKRRDPRPRVNVPEGMGGQGDIVSPVTLRVHGPLDLTQSDLRKVLESALDAVGSTKARAYRTGLFPSCKVCLHGAKCRCCRYGRHQGAAYAMLKFKDDAARMAVFEAADVPRWK